MSRTRKILFAAGFIIVAVAVAIVLMVLPDNTPERNENPDVSVTTPPIEAFTEQSAQYLEGKFNSLSKEDQQLALVPGMRLGTWDESTLFPDGTVLEIDHTSFEGIAEGGYVVRSSVVLDGEVLEEYLLQVEYVESEERWLVAGTTKIEGER